jgi:hypothetical protein
MSSMPFTVSGLDVYAENVEVSLNAPGHVFPSVALQSTTPDARAGAVSKADEMYVSGRLLKLMPTPFQFFLSKPV